MSVAVAGGTAFVAVFGVFVAAVVVLAVVTLRWAVRRDRAGRAEWVRRKAAASSATERAASNATERAASSATERRAGSPRQDRGAQRRDRGGGPRR